MRLSFITQFKIEFLLPFTGCRKVLGKMPAGKHFTVQRMIRQGIECEDSFFWEGSM